MENTNRPYTIDFIGLPGSGKSTIAHALLTYLRQKNMAVRGNVSLDPYTQPISKHESMLFLFVHPQIPISLALLMFRHHALHLFFTLLKYFTAYLIHTSKTHSIYMQEQGILNALFTAHARGDLSTDQVTHIVSDLHQKDMLPSIIVHVHAPLKIVVERLYSREKNHPLKSLTREESVVFMHAYDKCTEALISSIPSLPIPNIQSTQDISDIVQQIDDVLHTDPRWGDKFEGS
jgi:thymidylate kinase